MERNKETTHTYTQMNAGRPTWMYPERKRERRPTLTSGKNQHG